MSSCKQLALAYLDRVARGAFVGTVGPKAGKVWHSYSLGEGCRRTQISGVVSTLSRPFPISEVKLITIRDSVRFKPVSLHRKSSVNETIWFMNGFVRGKRLMTAPYRCWRLGPGSHRSHSDLL